MYQSEHINELASALAKAQSNIGPATKDGYNPFFKSKYADLSNVWAACKDPLNRNGLAIVQSMSYEEKQMILVTTLIHTSGQWMRSKLPISPTKNDIQGLGSAITYLRRYALAALAGVVTDDDDGNAAASSGNNKVSHKLSMPITKEKSKELKEILDECEPAYQSNFWKYLRQKVDSLQTLDQLPVDMYDQVKSGLIKKREEYLNEEKGVAYA